MGMRKALDRSQTRHLIMLNERLRAAQNQFNEFVEHLKEFYGIEDNTWQLTQDGKFFECPDKPVQTFNNGNGQVERAYADSEA